MVSAVSAESGAIRIRCSATIAIHERRSLHSKRRGLRSIQERSRLLGTLAILLVKLFVLIVRAGELPLDEKEAHLCVQFHRVAGGHDNVGNFSRLDGAQLLADAEHFRGIYRESLERLVVRHAESDG